MAKRIHFLIEPPMLHCRDLHVVLGRREVLAGVTASIRPGSLTALIGPNGSGKTTLFRTILGALRPARGTVLLGDTPLADLTPPDRARRLAYLSQRGTVAFAFSVRQVVRLGLLALDAPTSLAEQALADVDLLPLAERPFATLSIGQQQRASLARTLAQARAQRARGTPPLILADEPTAALDPLHAHAAMAVLAAEARAGATVLVALHDFSLARRWCEDALLLSDNGSLLAHGPTTDAASRANLEAAFKVTFGETAVSHPRGDVPVLVPLHPVESRGK